MPTIEFSSGKMYYDIGGSGDAVVLVPGFASGAWSWSWQVDDLSKSFRLITFDPRGVGRSEFARDEPITISVIADDIAGLLDEVDIESAHILVISFGGFVAQDFALRHADRTRRLVLASTSFGGPNHVAPAMEVLAAFASTEGLNTADRIRRYLTFAFSPEFAKTNAATVDRFCSLREENFVPREVYMQQLQSALGFDLESSVSGIRAKTLVITGDLDVVVPTENSFNLARAIPGARLEIIKGSGHMAFVEKADEFNRVVTDFLTGN